MIDRQTTTELYLQSCFISNMCFTMNCRSSLYILDINSLEIKCLQIFPPFYIFVLAFHYCEKCMKQMNFPRKKLCFGSQFWKFHSMYPLLLLRLWWGSTLQWNVCREATHAWKQERWGCTIPQFHSSLKGMTSLIYKLSLISSYFHYLPIPNAPC